MKSYLDLVPQYEKVHRKQSKMSRICIILAVFLVAVMFGLADMYLQGITQKVMQEHLLLFLRYEAPQNVYMIWQS